MSPAAWYWLILFLWAVGGAYFHWRASAQPQPWYAIGFDVLTVLLFTIIGLQLFGSPYKG